MRKTVFATSWHPGGMNAILPVIKKMMADEKVNVAVMGHEFSEDMLAKAKIPFKTFKDLGVPDISVESMEKVMDQLGVNVALTGTATQEGKANDILEQTVIRAANNLGIPSVAVLDMWEFYWQRFSDERTGKKLDVMPTYIATLDQLAYDAMVKEGFPEANLRITGNPHFDNLYAKGQSFTEDQRQEVRQKVGLRGDTLFFFAGNGFKAAKSAQGYWDLDVVKIIAEMMPQIPNVGAAVRLHPRMPEQDKAEIVRYIQESGANIKLVADVDSQTLALAADLTIVEFSTMGIEAVYMRRPTISLQPDMLGKDLLLISNEKIIPAGYTAQECKELLLKAATPEFRQELLERSKGFSNDGYSTERVTNLVYGLIGA